MSLPQKKKEASRMGATRPIKLEDGFVPVPVSLIDYFLTRYDLSSRAIKVYLVILRFSNQRGVFRPVPISIPKIASRLGVGKDTVIRAIKELEEKGFLIVDRSHHFNIYLPALPESDARQIISSLSDIADLAEVFRIVKELYPEPSKRRAILDDILHIEETLREHPKIGEPAKLTELFWNYLEKGDLLSFWAELEMLEEAPANAETLKRFEEKLRDKQQVEENKRIIADALKDLNEALEERQIAPATTPATKEEDFVLTEEQALARLTAMINDTDVLDREQRRKMLELQKKQQAKQEASKRLPAHKELYEAYLEFESNKEAAVKKIREGDIRYIAAGKLYDFLNSNGRADPEIASAILSVSLNNPQKFFESLELAKRVAPSLE